MLEAVEAGQKLPFFKCIFLNIILWKILVTQHFTCWTYLDFDLNFVNFIMQNNQITREWGEADWLDPLLSNGWNKKKKKTLNLFRQYVYSIIRLRWFFFRSELKILHLSIISPILSLLSNNTFQDENLLCFSLIWISLTILGFPFCKHVCLDWMKDSGIFLCNFVFYSALQTYSIHICHG